MERKFKIKLKNEIIMRIIDGHKIDQINNEIDIIACDEKENCGDNYEYNIIIKDSCVTKIKFQNGTIRENGINGITLESLVAICIDRLQCLQSGRFSCKDKYMAIKRLQGAQMWLYSRTRSRMKRNIE